MCDCARAYDVTESINHKLHFLNRKLITEGILRYFCHQSTFEDKLNVCRQASAGICLRCFEKGALHSLFTLETMGFPECSVSRFTETDRNRPKRTRTDRHGLMKIPKRTSRSTETGLNNGSVEQSRAGQGWAGTYFVPTSYLPTY